MTAHDDLDLELAAFLREGPDELPFESFDAVRDRMEQTRQRVVIGPWRAPTMNRFVTFGLAAVAVVAVLLIGSQLFRSPTLSIGSETTPTPEPSPTATSRPTPSPVAPPPLTQSFTSAVHGILISYPEGWSTHAATKPWTRSTFPLSFPMAQVDWLYDTDLTSDLFLDMASQPIGNAAPGEWIAAQMASGEGCGMSNTDPITLDGASGLIGTGHCDIAVVTTAGRGYWIQLYTSGDLPLDAYDRAWFEEVLATVQLRPKDAVD